MPDTAPEPLNVETPVETEPTTTVDTVDESATFDLDYVRALRSEAADARVRAKVAHDEANARLLRVSIERDGRLVDPDVLQLNDDLVDDDGWVDPTKVADAISARIEEKPYLATPRPRTVIAQGVRETPPTPVSLSEAIRARM